MEKKNKSLYFWAIIPGVGTIIFINCIYNMYKSKNKNFLKTLIIVISLMIIAIYSMIVLEHMGLIVSMSIKAKDNIGFLIYSAFWGYITIYAVIYNYYKDTENIIDLKKRELFSINKQYIFSFIPVINVFVVFVIALKNMDKMKSLLTFIVFSLPALVVSFVIIEFDTLFDNSNVTYILMYVISIIFTLSWIICQKIVVRKKIFLGEIILEDKKMVVIY